MWTGYLEGFFDVEEDSDGGSVVGVGQQDDEVVYCAPVPSEDTYVGIRAPHAPLEARQHHFVPVQLRNGPEDVWLLGLVDRLYLSVIPGGQQAACQSRRAEQGQKSGVSGGPSVCQHGHPPMAMSFPLIVPMARRVGPSRQTRHAPP